MARSAPSETRPEYQSAAVLRSRELVGRTKELHELIACVTNPPSIVLIEGDAGVGKTRLVHELLARAEATPRRFVGRCHALEESFPLSPLVDAFRNAAELLQGLGELNPVVGALRPLLPELSEVVPPTPEPLSDPRAERHQVFRALVEVLSAVDPCILVLEDIQWADEVTLEFLRFLRPNLPPRTSVIVTRRSAGPSSGELAFLFGSGEPRPATIHLEPLPANDVRELCAHLLGGPSSEMLADFLVELAGGLPFATEELVSLLRQKRDIDVVAGEWTLQEDRPPEVPLAIREQILERLSLLPDSAKLLARAASVFQGAFEDDALWVVSGMEREQSLEATSLLLACGLIQEDVLRTYLFRHALARQAVYESVASPERREFHRRAASFLSERGDDRHLSEVADHYRRVGDEEAWIEYTEKAADFCVSVHDEAGACRLLQDVLDGAALSTEMRARLSMKLANAALHGLEHNKAIALLRRTLETEELERGDRGELRVWLGTLMYQGGDSAGCNKEIRQALPDLAERPDVEALAAMVLAGPWAFAGTMTEHLEWLDRAAAVGRRVDDPSIRASVEFDRAAILYEVGMSEGRSAVAALRIGDSDDERRQFIRAQLNLAQGAVYLGEYTAARDFVEAGLQVGDDIGYGRFRPALEITECMVDWYTGSWDGLAERAADLADATREVPHMAADAIFVQGELALVTGDVATAETLLHDVAKIAKGCGSARLHGAARSTCARLKLVMGDGEASLAEATAALEPIRAKGIWAWAGDAAPATARSLVNTGRLDEARALAETLRTETNGVESPTARAAAEWVDATVSAAMGEDERAESAFLLAERAWTRCGRPYTAALVTEDHGAFVRGERGNDLLVDALHTFEVLGAQWDAARIRRRLRARGVAAPRPSRSGRRGYGGRLSPREQEIVALAAAGATNRAIGSALFLSPRTVEHHLSRAMRKLGVTSRRDLMLGVSGEPASLN